jgi:hypothetical protein
MQVYRRQSRDRARSVNVSPFIGFPWDSLGPLSFDFYDMSRRGGTSFLRAARRRPIRPTRCRDGILVKAPLHPII